ncbi:MAG: hypothetical protein ACRENL_05525 [Candidatus Dormibacteria bacterium]
MTPNQPPPPPPPGRSLAAAVHRPLAEQLAALAAPGPDERVLELGAGDGELTERLLGATTGSGTVEVQVRPWNLAVADGTFDLAVSLLALHPDQELAAVLSELARIAMRAQVAVWTDGATHENALRAAWHDVAGEDLAATTLPERSAPAHDGWRQSRLRDVARFDGVDHALVALTAERGISVPAGVRTALRDRLAHHLAACTAADGTLRIPVHADVLSWGDDQPGARP